MSYKFRLRLISTANAASSLPSLVPLDQHDGLELTFGRHRKSVDVKVRSYLILGSRLQF